MGEHQSWSNLSSGHFFPPFPFPSIFFVRLGGPQKGPEWVVRPKLMSFGAPTLLTTCHPLPFFCHARWAKASAWSPQLAASAATRNTSRKVGCTWRPRPWWRGADGSKVGRSMAPREKKSVFGSKERAVWRVFYGPLFTFITVIFYSRLKVLILGRFHDIPRA